MWRFVLAALVIAAVLLTLFGAWYARESQWHASRPGYEARVEIQLWPPGLAWGERAVPEP